MKILFIGVETAQGRKKEGGMPYGPFYFLRHAVPVEKIESANRQVDGHGYRILEANISPLVYEQFKQCKPLTTVEIDVQPDPANFSRTIIAGVVKSSAAA